MTETEEFEFRHRLETEQEADQPRGPLDRLKTQTGAVMGELKNAGLGALRGAGSIGATILAPNDMLAQRTGLMLTGNPMAPLAAATGDVGRSDRRQAMTDATQTLGADPNSMGYKVAKLAAEAAGTSGAGGLLAKGAQGLGAAPQVINALRTSGFSTGSSALSAGQSLALRSGAGALAGGAQVGLASPEDAGTGAVIGGALPGAAKVLGLAGNALGGAAQDGAKALMRSALKPTEKMRNSGDADVAVQTLLDYGINPTNSGVNKLKGMIGDLNDQISAAIDKSGAKIDKDKVLNALAETRKKFANQVDPAGDLSAIDKVAEGFQGHPNYPGNDLPIQAAQDLKQGTYRVLRGKYGEAGSASTEAQKGLARGLKDEIASAAPEVGPLNAEESRLLKTLVVTERRALLDANKNPIDLGSVFALASGHPGVALGSLANSTAWSKAMAARGLNALSSGPPASLNALAGPAAYRAIPGTARR